MTTSLTLFSIVSLETRAYWRRNQTHTLSNHLRGKKPFEFPTSVIVLSLVGGMFRKCYFSFCSPFFLLKDFHLQLPFYWGGGLHFQELTILKTYYVVHSPGVSVLIKNLTILLFVSTQIIHIMKLMSLLMIIFLLKCDREKYKNT